MIRKSTFSLRYSNIGKIKQLDRLMEESVRVVNLYIGILWDSKLVKFVGFKVDTWLSARMQQALGKQASEIVKSVRLKRGKKRKPVFNRPVINLDSRFVDIRFDDNSFDVWVRLSSLGDRMQLRLPSKRHRHFLKLKDDGFVMRNGARLRRVKEGIYEIDVYMEKDEPAKRTRGKVIGLDCGYKRMLVSSEGDIYDQGLEDVYGKISRKVQGSKAFKRGLVERDNLINRTINDIGFGGVREVVVEDLKGVKKGTKGRLRKSFNNKLQRWSYPKVLGKVSRMCEELGVTLTRVNPAYTSQKCSLCGDTDKRSRNGVRFKCVSCGVEMDADYNAAINISHMGVYSLHATGYQ